MSANKIPPPPPEAQYISVLSDWYHSLPPADRDQFLSDLAAAGFREGIFWVDAAPGSYLSLISFWRLDWYRAWFLEYGYADLFTYVRQETNDTPYQAPKWESKLEARMVADFQAVSGPNALPQQEFYRTTPHGQGQLVRLISEHSQRELDPQRKPMWQALRALIHQLRG